MHLILILAPFLLLLSILTLVVRELLQIHQRRQLLEPWRPTRDHVGGLERNFLAQIVRNTQWRQAGLLLLSLTHMPPLYLSLEMPEQIVKNVLEPAVGPAEIFGFTFGQMQMLGQFSAIYLAANCHPSPASRRWLWRSAMPWPA